MQWTISNYSDRETQTISPAGRPYLQVAPGPRVYDFVMILPSAGYVWTIKGNGTYMFVLFPLSWFCVLKASTRTSALKVMTRHSIGPSMAQTLDSRSLRVSRLTTIA